jgi:selenoprotein W-related protein
LKELEWDIETFSLIPSDGGKFELKVNEQLLYSKLKTGRHVEKGEIIDLLRKFRKEMN